MKQAIVQGEEEVKMNETPHNKTQVLISRINGKNEDTIITTITLMKMTMNTMNN